MELLKSIRIKTGTAILRNRASGNRRKAFFKNFDAVKTIGIVWNPANSEDFKTLAKFHQQMAERNIDVHVIGYYDGKNLPDIYTAIRYLTCIRKHEVNMFYIPMSNDAKDFINKKFDVLIDINFEKIFPLSYITVMSKALFKSGLFEKENPSAPFDLMMEIKKPAAVDNYLKQTVQYLEMINA